MESAQRLAFIDTETTSLQVEHGEIWDVAVITREPGTYNADQEWTWTWWPALGHASPDSMRMNRLYERLEPLGMGRMPVTSKTYPVLSTFPDEDGEIGTQAVTFRRAAWQIVQATHNAVLVGACPWFDTGFLVPWLSRWGFVPSWHYHLRDVETLVAGALTAMERLCIQLPGAKRDELRRIASPPGDSTALSLAVGVNPDHFDRHTALGDALWARAMYDAVMKP